ncbi:MAG TPA: rRNA maturation RNase YbeY [Candidatus Acidoferrales bacterium]|nr:rRNA maturation RNase YbeY [Candidatus Acidoferrales bacterium]
MTIHYRNDVRGGGVDARALKSALRKLLASVDCGDAGISLTIVDDKAIRKLNREHRGKDKPTDVLSFPLEPEPFASEKLLGDIVISIDTARRQAAGYDAPVQRELERLMIHGLLHVLGHDHMEPGEQAAMEAEERRLAAAIGMPWPYES